MVSADQASSGVLFTLDTDSGFLRIRPGVKPPEVSNKLGGLKDEVYEEHGSGHRIVRFGSLGAKTYNYAVANSEGEIVQWVMKTKGLTHSAQALETLNPEAMDHLLTDRESEIRVKQFQIARDMNKTRLFSRTTQKRLRFTSKKRALDPNTLVSFPYGYVPECDLDDLLHGLEAALDE